MNVSDEKIASLGDKDLKHYYEVLLLQQYWGADRAELIVRFEEEMRRRSLDPDEAKRILMERTPELDTALEALWAGKPYMKEASDERMEDS